MNSNPITDLYATLPARFPELKGKVALVTGSSQNVGLGIALRLAREGMRVMITGLESQQVNDVTAQIRNLGADVTGFAGDLRETETINRLFDETLNAYGTVDVLVNNAADLRRLRTLDMSDDLLDYQLALNIRTPVLCARRAGQIMRDAGTGGSIIHITSVGAIRAHELPMPYDMSKGAIDATTRSMAVDMAQHNIRVNAIAPGFVLTENVKRHQQENPEALAVAFGRIPLGRPVYIEEIGAAAAYLASPDAAYMTGQILYIDGGISIQISPPGHPL